MLFLHRNMNKDGGCIVTMSSIFGDRGNAKVDLPYAISKHGINGEAFVQLDRRLGISRSVTIPQARSALKSRHDGLSSSLNL